MERALKDRDSALTELRGVLREKFAEAHRSPAPREMILSGVDWIDEGSRGGRTGGIPKGGISEVCGSSMSGGAALIGRMLRYAIGERQRFVLLDGSDSFDPAMFPVFSGAVFPGDGNGLDEAGLSGDLSGSFVWARCRGAGETLRVADLILRDGNFPRTVIDLQMTPIREIRAIPRSSWLRLRSLTADSGVSCLVLTPEPVIPCAAIRWELEGRFTLDDLECPEFVWAERAGGRMQMVGA